MRPCRPPRSALPFRPSLSTRVYTTRLHRRRAAPLPFELADASRLAPTDGSDNSDGGDGAAGAGLGLDTRLNVRHLSLRTPAAAAVFALQSAISGAFRGALAGRGFIEIHSPKLIAGASEGGAEVFALDYFGSPACLAQSPQLYKQMAICADFGRVFEVGPVFRAEHSFTHRHLCEFTGVDLEMEILEHYSEVMDVLEAVFADVFAALEASCGAELLAVARQFPFEPFVFKPLRLPYAEGIQVRRGRSVRNVRASACGAPKALPSHLPSPFQRLAWG